MTDGKHQSITVVEKHDHPETMHPLVRAAMATGSLDPTTLRELLAVQREYEAGEAKRAYTRALVALKRDLPTVIKRDKVVDFTSAKGRTRYTHASLASAMDAVTEPLTRHGFSLSWTPQTTQQLVTVTCRLTHSEGHHEEASISAPADTSGSKNPAQAVASTITLLQRYTALSLLGIATADMQEPEKITTIEPEHVDTARNLKAVAWAVKQGHTREQAEAFIGRSVSEWTAADLERLKEWVLPSSAAG